MAMGALVDVNAYGRARCASAMSSRNRDSGRNNPVDRGQPGGSARQVASRAPSGFGHWRQPYLRPPYWRTNQNAHVDGLPLADRAGGRSRWRSPGTARPRRPPRGRLARSHLVPVQADRHAPHPVGERPTSSSRYPRYRPRRQSHAPAESGSGRTRDRQCHGRRAQGVWSPHECRVGKRSRSGFGLAGGSGVGQIVLLCATRKA